MKRILGLLGSWALLVLSFGLAAFAIAGETINIREERRLDRVAEIDKLITERAGSKAETLRGTAAQKTASVNALQAKLQDVAKQTDDLPDTGSFDAVPCAHALDAPSPNGAAEITVTGRGASLRAQNNPARPAPNSANCCQSVP